MAAAVAIEAMPRTTPTWRAAAIVAALAACGWLSSGVAAQEPQPTASAVIDEIIASARPDVPVTLTLANRDIVQLRASILGRSSTDRVQTAGSLLRQIAGDEEAVQVGLRPVGSATFVTVSGRDVFVILPADVDELSGETLDSKAQATVAHLQQAFDELAEASSPRRLLWSVLLSLLPTLVFVAIIFGLRRGGRRARAWLAAMTDRRLSDSQAAAAALVRQTHFVQYAQRGIDVASVVILLILGYVWLGFVLRRFPYTRPWGDSLRGFLFSQLEWMVLGFVNAMPGLITVALIVVVMRVVIRLATLFFDAVERGHVRLRWVFPDTAAPTRKIVTALLWLFALVVAYPFLPGSGTEAFKGVSVFVGLIISLGSTGIVNQLMSGLTLTYSRALHVGDYVRVGEVEGTVTHLGTLSTKIDTVQREEVTIPNAVLVSREVINYSKDAQSSEVFVPTSVTIGYDTPWRQIHSLLLLAAERTPGLRRNPVPIVVQAGLEDFYVKYTLFVCLDDPRQRILNLAALHANIQDVFNEYGVQIMSPHYWTDPQSPKVVPKEHWAPPPARGQR